MKKLFTLFATALLSMSMFAANSAVDGLSAVNEGLILDVELDVEGYVVTPNMPEEKYAILLINQSYFSGVEAGIAAMLPYLGNHMLVSGAQQGDYKYNVGFYGAGDYWLVAVAAYYDEEEEELVQNGEATIKEVALDKTGTATLTGINNVDVNAAAVKVVRDGQLIIVRESVEFNANGARL